MNLGEMFRSEVVVVPPNAACAEVVQKMDDESVGAVVVVEDRKVVGIVTDRDLALALGQSRATPSTPVHEVMSHDVTTIRENEGVFNATQYLLGYQFRRLPVVNSDDELVGMVTADDLVTLLARELYNVSKCIAPVLADKVA